MLALRQLETAIKNDYYKYVVLRDSEKGRSQDTIQNYLKSRGLLAFYLKNYSKCPDDKISKRIVDGFKDNGIDGIFYNHNEKTLYIIQTKWIKNGSSGIESGDVLKFISGIKDLLVPKYANFNQDVRALNVEIEMALLEPNVKIVMALVATTQQQIPIDTKRLIDEFVLEQNSVTNFVEFEYVNLSNLHNVLRNGAIDQPIDTDILLLKWNDISSPIKAVIGMINGNDLSDLVIKNGKRIFSPNIRYFLGKTDVNELIIETCKINPSIFWYLNNGITAIVSKFDKKPIGGQSRETGIFNCSGFSIVNGAQTTGAIAEAKKQGVDVSNIIVSIRIIEIPESMLDLGVEITRSNNTQNRVDSRDFVSLDPNQEKIYEELIIEGIIYAYKSGDVIPDGVDGFNFDEGAVAMACSMGNIDLMVQAKSKVSKLWSNTEKEPYKILFNEKTEGPYVWEQVKIMRKVEYWIKERKRDLNSRDRQIIAHGNRFILYLVYKDLHSKTESLRNVEQEAISEIAERSFAFLKQVIDQHYPQDQLASLFKNTLKCNDINEKVISYS